MLKSFRRLLGLGLVGVMFMTAVPAIAFAQTRGGQKGGKRGGGKSGRKRSPTKGGRGGSR